MKKIIISAVLLIFGFSLLAQNHQLKAGLKFEKPILKQKKISQKQNQSFFGELSPPLVSRNFKNTKAINIIDIGTSANAYSYGYAGGQRSLLCVNDELGIVSNFHRMGGVLDPGGYSGDLGFDVSIDLGQNWTCMNECYAISGGYPGFYETARYPQHGIFNPPGNTNPEDAYIVFFAPALDCSNAYDSWGGYCYGRAKIGDIADTTKHLITTHPELGIYQYIPDGFTVTSTGDFWAVDYNLDLYEGDDGIWLQQLILNHGIWNEDLEDYELTQTLLPCPTLDTTAVPQCARVEFSPDGQYGYIAVIADNGNVDISAGQSFYPILWRSDDFGQTWTGPIEVALAGSNGISGVQNFLSADEIEELYDPMPDPDEILFTTAFDFDLSVDVEGNPIIAVVIGITADEPYSIITQKSVESGYLFMASFLLISEDKGNQGSWNGRELGRLASFRGNYGDIYEDNRIQIARDHEGEKMFVAWLDTDTTVSAENNTPDIWARGYDISSFSLTYNIETLMFEPQNLSYGSAATFAAHFFAMGDEVIYNDDLSWPVYIMPMVYEQMTPTDPEQPVQYKYIQNAFFWEQQFLTGPPPPPGIKEFESILADVSEIIPNPASTLASFSVILKRPAMVNIKLLNLTGQTLQIFSKKLNAGSNEITIDVSDLKSGIYFLTIEVGGEAITRKVIVD